METILGLKTSKKSNQIKQQLESTKQVKLMVKESLAVSSLTEQVLLLQQINTAIALVPSLDFNKIEEARKKLKNKQLGLLNSKITARFKSAERIAAHMLDIDQI